MESLTVASESFYDNSNKEEVNVDLFNSFMRHITLWDYAFITRAIIFYHQIMKKRS